MTLLLDTPRDNAEEVRVSGTVPRGLLDELPPYLQGDPSVRAVLDAVGRELARVLDAAERLSATATPSRATDDLRILALWEATLKLTVEPAGKSVEDRRTLILSAWQGRRTGAGDPWRAAMVQALGTEDWTFYRGPTPYTITINMPFGQDQYGGIDAVANLTSRARPVTPANLAFNFQFGSGFIVGVSDVGDTL